MDRKVKKNEQTDKKYNSKPTKGQGDNMRKNTAEKQDNLKLFLPDRGDTNRKTNQTNDKVKTNFNEKKKSFDLWKPKNADRSTNIESVTKPTDTRATATQQTKTPSDLEEKRNSRERNSLKSKNNNSQIVSSTLVKKLVKDNIKNEKTADRFIKNLPNVETQLNEKHNESGKSNTKPDKKLPNESFVQRKPIIQTVTSKNDSRIYKAVTFVDQKRKLPTPLHIKIPSDTQKKQASKIKMKQEGNNVAVKENPITIRKIKYQKRHKKRDTTSPELRKGAVSPATEVARWAPSCINHHTKPYYEAWVNTTLAAISKNSKRDKSFIEKHNLLKSIQRTLQERPETPDLIYEKINDERYTGRIRVRHK